MAGEKCSLTCNIKDSRGQVKVSALWEGLSNFFKGDRKAAITHYFLTKDSNFLMQNSDVLEFDADGEVTIASLKKALERDGEYSNMSNAKVLLHLNKEIGTGRYDYSEAIDNVLKFNRQNVYNKEYMATLKRDSEGKYMVEVVRRTPDTEAELVRHVENKLQEDAVVSLLRSQGLSVEFLTNPKYALKYASGNLVEGADGLYSVGQVMAGLTSSAATAEIAGHFIVSAMKDGPLVQRLVQQMTPEVQEAIFKNPKSNLYREDFIVSSESAMEAAGILVGKELLSPFKEKVKWYSAQSIGSVIPKTIAFLVNKIKNFAKRVLGIYTPDVVGKLVSEAKASAATVAQGYITNAETVNNDNVFDNQESFAVVRSSKYLSDRVKANVAAYKETVGYLKDTMAKLKDVISRSGNSDAKDILKKLQELHKNIILNNNDTLELEAFAQNASIEGMVYILENITNILNNDIRSLLESVQPSDRINSYNNIVENARNMRTVEIMARSMAQLYDVMYKKVNSLNATEQVGFIDSDGNRIVGTLREALSRLGEVLGANDEVYVDSQNQKQTVYGLRSLIELKSRQVWCDFAESIYGKDFIERNAGIVWSQDGKLQRGDRIEGYNEVKIKDWIASMTEDISLMDKYIRSAADCADFMSATGYKIARKAQMDADRITERYWNLVESLRLQMQDIYGTTDCSFLYETMTDENGNTVLSGNLVSTVNHGMWEEERRKFANQLKEDFNDYLAELRKKAYENNKNNPGFVFTLTDFQKSVLYHNFADSKWKRWHNENSEEEKGAFGKKRLVPNHVKYHSQQWDDLFDHNLAGSEAEKRRRIKGLQLYSAIIEMKEEMDSMLPAHSTVTWRAPQFTGKSYHRFSNLNKKMQNSRAAFGNMLRKKVIDTFAVRQDEAYLFGSNNEFNEIEEDPLENNMYFEKEKINRLPLFGINKLKDMTDLSTDLFGSLVRYASMASTYMTYSRIVDMAELGSDVMRHRQIGGTLESDRKESSRAMTRYMKFLQNNIYNVHVTAPKFDSKGMMRKLANTLSSVASRLFLGGNVLGGAVNTGTGVIEILKEAATGEFFTTSDLNKALKMYFDGVFSPDGYGGSFTNMLANPLRPMDKNNLWIRHWNITSKRTEFYRNQKYDRNEPGILRFNNRLWEWYDHTLWLPYSSGDHFMQCIPFYALGIHQKVYDIDGKEMSLIDAYDIVDGKKVRAVGEPDDADPIGKTYKRLQLRDNIFRSAEDIEKYKTVTDMLDKINNFFTNNPTVRNTADLALDFFSDEQREYLYDEGLAVPENVKQLDQLRTSLRAKSASLKFSSTDESAFLDKCRNITNRLHGIYNMEDKTVMHNNIVGNMFLAMKGYALGYINRNFSENYYNFTLGKSVEGSYNTLYKVMRMAFASIYNADNWAKVNEALLLIVPGANLYGLFSKDFNNRLKLDMQNMGFSEHQYYNMRRVGFNFFAIESLFMFALLSAANGPWALGDDDDKQKAVDIAHTHPMLGLLYYLFTRWNREQRAYVEPNGMYDEVGSLLTIPTGLAGMGQILDIAQLFIRTQFDKLDGEIDISNSDLYYQTSKEGFYEAGDAKWLAKFLRYVPYYRSYYQMQHPYEAAKNYEYGRKVRR